MDQNEVADRGGDGEAELLELGRRPGEPLLVVLDRGRDMGLVRDRCGAGLDGGAIDVERTADALERIDDVISVDELRALSDGYKAVSGSAKTTLQGSEARMGTTSVASEDGQLPPQGNPAA